MVQDCVQNLKRAVAHMAEDEVARVEVAHVDGTHAEVAHEEVAHAEVAHMKVVHAEGLSPEVKALLWETIVACQGHTFKTLGRGKNHAGAVEFTYSLKVSSRTGEFTDELVISRREGKTITKSSVELALARAIDVQREKGFVKGPKSIGQIFGISYLYAMFLEWGLIRCAAPEAV